MMNDKFEKQKQALSAIREALFRRLISPLAAKKALRAAGLNMKVTVGGHKDNSKWTINELIEIRKRNGVGRPPAIGRARMEKRTVQA